MLEFKFVWNIDALSYFVLMVSESYIVFVTLTKTITSLKEWSTAL